MNVNKYLDVKVKLNIVAMEASSKEPIGPTLGQYGVPIDKFCNLFNEVTKIYNEKVLLRVLILIYSDKTFELIIKSPSINVTINKCLENYNLNKIKKKAGFFFEENEYLPSLNKNIIYTIVLFSKSLNQSSNKIKEISLFKKLIGTLNSAGILIYTK